MIIPVITYNKDQIQGVLEELCRGFALRYWGNYMEIEVTLKGWKLDQFGYLSRIFTPSEKVVLGVKTQRCQALKFLEILPQAKAVMLGAKMVLPR
jgi:hypothetical protein